MTGNSRDYRVELEEFVEYYTNVSASIDDDMYFMQMMNSAWNLSGDAASYTTYKKGWSNDDTGAANKQQQNSVPSGY